MEVVIGLVIILAIGYGARRFLRARVKKQEARQARADKREKIALADARAMKRCLEERRR